MSLCPLPATAPRRAGLGAAGRVVAGGGRRASADAEERSRNGGGRGPGTGARTAGGLGVGLRGRRSCARWCRSLRRCGGKRPGAIPALGYGRQRCVGARGGRAGRVRGHRPRSRYRCRPRRSSVISPSATRSRRAGRQSAVVFVPLPFLRATRRQRDGCGRGSGARPQHRCAGGFLRTTSHSSRARVPWFPTTGDVAKLTFLESSHDQAGFRRPWVGAGALVAALLGSRALPLPRPQPGPGHREAAGVQRRSRARRPRLWLRRRAVKGQAAM